MKIDDEIGAVRANRDRDKITMDSNERSRVHDRFYRVEDSRIRLILGVGRSSVTTQRGTPAAPMAGRDVMAEPTNKPINGATICSPAGVHLSSSPWSPRPSVLAILLPFVPLSLTLSLSLSLSSVFPSRSILLPVPRFLVNAPPGLPSTPPPFYGILI